MIELLVPMVCGGVLRAAGTHVVLEEATEARMVSAGNAFFAGSADVFCVPEDELPPEELPPEELPLEEQPSVKIPEGGDKPPDAKQAARGKAKPAPAAEAEINPAQVQFGRGLGDEA